MRREPLRRQNLMSELSEEYWEDFSEYEDDGLYDFEGGFDVLDYWDVMDAQFIDFGDVMDDEVFS